MLLSAPPGHPRAPPHLLDALFPPSGSVFLPRAIPALAQGVPIFSILLGILLLPPLQSTPTAHPQPSSWPRAPGNLPSLCLPQKSLHVGTQHPLCPHASVPPVSPLGRHQEGRASSPGGLCPASPAQLRALQQARVLTASTLLNSTGAGAWSWEVGASLGLVGCCSSAWMGRLSDATPFPTQALS